jgi:PAS domain S-box-containing protein
MFRPIRTRLKVSSPAQEQGFGQLFTVALIWPLVLMAALAGLLTWQVKLLLSEAQALNDANQLISKFSLTQKLFIDLETGVRGYQITGNQDFLQPYREARQLITPTLDELDRQIGDITPLEKAQVASLRSEYKKWESFVQKALLAKNKVNDARILALNLQGKQQMDLIRSSIAKMEERALAKRAQRNQNIEQKVPVSLTIIIGTFLTGAGLLAILSRNQLRYLSQKYEHSLTSVRTQTEAIEEGEIRYRSLIEAISEIVWSTDVDGQVVTELPDWGTFTGQSFEEYKGWGWLNAIHPEDQERTNLAWTESVRERRLHADEHRLRRFDGIYRYMRIRGVPIIGEDGVVREWVGIHTDIDERKRAEEALAQRAEEQARLSEDLRATAARLEERNRELDQFNYVVSHDLKAPLRAIGSLSEWIEEDLQDQLNDESRRNMRLLRARVYRLEALINGLLQYSRLGQTKMSFGLVPVAELLTEVIDSLGPPSGFTVTVEPPMPVLTTDRMLLGQVFTNLIDNAITHHDRPQGQVKITVSDQENFYKFAVSDDGPGIDERFYERIFSIFQTLEPRDKREGTGIGLALVKRIIERQGGQSWVVSQIGAGSTFYFTWPKNAPEPEDNFPSIADLR